MRSLEYPSFAFLAGAHRFVLYGVAQDQSNAEAGASDQGGLLTSMLVFEDDQYVGTLDPVVALGYPTCLAQPGGTLLLAERLQSLTSGHGDPLARKTPDGESTFGALFCPSGLPTLVEAEPITNSYAPILAEDATPPPLAAEAPQEPPDSAKTEAPPMAADRKRSSIATAGVVAEDTLMGAAAVVILPFMIPELIFQVIGTAVIAGPTIAVEETHDHASLVGQEKILLDMPVAELSRTMGTPKATFHLNPVHSEVRYFNRWAHAPLWIGLEDGRVVWLRFGYSNYWSTATARLSKVSP
jgi:hypothetical protein